MELGKTNPKIEVSAAAGERKSAAQAAPVVERATAETCVLEFENAGRRIRLVMRLREVRDVF